jgi:hypothetical protein
MVVRDFGQTNANCPPSKHSTGSCTGFEVSSIQRIFRRVLTQLGQTEMNRLDDLLKTTEIVQRQSALQDLKEVPKKPSLTHLDLLLDHLEWLQVLTIGGEALRQIPAALVRHFAAAAKVLRVNELRVVQPAKRYTLLICLLYRMQLRTRDDVVDMFVKRMMKIHNRARERLLQIQARQRETAEHLISTLAGMLEVVGTDGSADERIHRIEHIVAEGGGLDSLREGCEAVQAWSNNNYFPLLARPYQRHRHLLFRLARTLQLVSTTQDQSLLTALQFVIAHQDRRAE